MNRALILFCVILLSAYLFSCAADTGDIIPTDTTDTVETSKNPEEKEKREYDESEYPVEELVIWSGESLEFVVFEGKNFCAGNGIVLPYRIYIPDDYDDSKKYPVLLYLHGRGTSGDDNILHLNDVKKVFLSSDSPAYDSIVIAPHCSLDGWWGYDYTDAVVELVENLGEKYSIDFDRIYSTGNSMGGAGSFDLALRHSDFVTAVLPAAHGSFDYEDYESYAADIPMNYDPQILNVPMYFIYDLTDNTVWYEPIQRAIRYIKNKGGNKVIYKETYGLDHQVGDVYISRDDISGLEWLYSNVKSASSSEGGTMGEPDRQNSTEKIKLTDIGFTFSPDFGGTVDISSVASGGTKFISDITRCNDDGGLYIGYKKTDYDGNGVAIFYVDNGSDIDCNVAIRTTYYSADGKSLGSDTKSFKGLLSGRDNYFIFTPEKEFSTCKYNIVIESIGDGEMVAEMIDYNFYCLGEDVSPVNGDHIGYAVVNVENFSQYIVYATIRCVVFDKNGETVFLSDKTYPVIAPDVGAEPSLNGMAEVILYRGREEMPENWMEEYSVIYEISELNRNDHTKN
ncbi:MAG: hypothetical protein IKT70_01890 [Clostridia bacterium]|nr:hypothetical protein [Clostridia bacterium]